MQWLKQIFLFLLLLFSLSAAAQEYVTAVQHWDVKDGLSHRKVNSINFDKKGFLWLGTDNGLNRFDGINFRWYTHEKNGLPFNDIQQVIEDVDGNLLLMNSQYKQLVLYNPQTGNSQPFEQVAGIPQPKAYLPIRPLPDSGFIVAFDDSFYVWKQSEGLRKLPFIGGHNWLLKTTSSNTLIILQRQRFLFEMTLTGTVLQKDTLPVAINNTYSNLPARGLFLRDINNRQVYYSGTDFTSRNFTDSLPPADDSKYYSLQSTGIDDITWFQGMLWSPRTGVIRDFIQEGITTFKNPETCFIADDNGRIWIGTDFGFYLIKVARNKFRQYFYIPHREANRNSFRGLFVRDHKLYAAREANAVIAQSTTSAKTPIEKLYSNEAVFGVYAVKEITGNELVFSVRDNIYKYPLNKTGGQVYTFTGNPGADCWSMYEMVPGKLLLGLSPGLAWMNTATGSVSPFTQYNRFSELNQALVLDISADADGKIWLSTNKGFYEYDSSKGIVARYSSSDSGHYYIPAKEVQHFYRDGQGIFWLATTQGLLRWDKANRQSRLYTRADGLSNNTIYAVYEDSSNHLWLSSDYGIMQFNKATGNVIAYLTEDGITHTEFNRIAHHRDPDGNIYFGSLNGVTAFHPRDFTFDEENSKRAPLEICSYQQFDGDQNILVDKTASLVQTNRITLYPDDRFFTIEFALLNYLDPGYTTYYWKIDDADAGWNSQKDRTIRLSRLPYGNRVLHIKAQASDGSWSKNELLIHIRVIKPVYLRAWFITGVFLLLALAGYAIYRWRIYRLQQENKRLDSIVKDKTHDLLQSLQQKEVLLKEIHHRVKNNLQVIGSLLRLQSGSIKDSFAKKILLEGQNRVFSMALIHKKLYEEDSLGKVEFADFSNDLFQQLKTIFPVNEAPVTLLNKIKSTYLDIDIAVPLGLILNELFTNSFKYAFTHTAEPQVSLALEKKEDCYSLIYSDNGPGLPEHINLENSHTMGLRLITRLSRQLNGKATYAGGRFEIVFTEAVSCN